MQGLQPSGLQVAEIMLVELGQVGLTINSILLKDIYLPLDVAPASRAANANLCLCLPPSCHGLYQM
jgi:hypothetical protein